MVLFSVSWVDYPPSISSWEFERNVWSKTIGSHLGLRVHVLYDGSSGKSGMLLLMLLLIVMLMRQRVSSLALLEKRVGIVRRAFHNVPVTTIDLYEVRNGQERDAIVEHVGKQN